MAKHMVNACWFSVEAFSGMCSSPVTRFPSVPTTCSHRASGNRSPNSVASAKKRPRRTRWEFFLRSNTWTDLISSLSVSTAVGVVFLSSASLPDATNGLSMASRQARATRGSWHSLDTEPLPGFRFFPLSLLVREDNIFCNGCEWRSAILDRCGCSRNSLSTCAHPEDPLRRQLTSNPVSLLCHDDAQPGPKRRDCGGATSKTAANHDKVRLQLPWKFVGRAAASQPHGNCGHTESQLSQTLAAVDLHLLKTHIVDRVSKMFSIA